MDEASRLYAEWAVYIDALLVTHFEAQRKAGIHWTTEEQEDLSQVVRIKCWEALRIFDPSKSSPKTYLYRVVKHQLAWRSMDMRGTGDGKGNNAMNYRMAHYDDKLAKIPEPAAQQVTDAEEDVIADMTEEQQAYVRYKLDGMSGDEIRGVMGVSKKRLTEIRREIHAALTGNNNEEENRR